MKLSDKDLVLNVRGGVRMRLPPTLGEITSYVMLEQEDWFEDEIRFVRRCIRPGMQVLDVGANYGAYTLPLAAAVGPGGRVWAFEPTPDTADFLQATLELNGLGHVRLERVAVSSESREMALAMGTSSEANFLGAAGESITVPGTTLDERSRAMAWDAIDFVKIDVEGHEPQVVHGGEAFFRRASPLVMLEIKAAEGIDLTAANLLAGLGYGLYRLLPGPLFLVPFQPGEAMDDFLLNLFACKSDRAERLAAAGHLALSHVAQPGKLSAAAWADYVASAPYAQPHAARWPSKAALLAPASDKVYYEGLAAYARSISASVPLAVRHAALELALARLRRAADSTDRDRIGRLLSLARVAREAGRRLEAADALARALQLLNDGDEGVFDEPFIAPGARYEAAAGGAARGDWLLCAIVEEFERLRTISSLFTPEMSMGLAGRVRELPQCSPEMERRWQLCHLYLERQAAPQAAARLCERSEENLNPAFWCRGSARPEELTDRAAELQRRGEHAEAERLYREAIAAAPSLGQAWFNLGTLLLNHLRNDEALEVLRRAASLEKRAPWLTALGSACERSGRTDEAQAVFREAIALDPAHAPAHEALGIALVNAGEAAAALAHFRRALEIDPQAQSAWSNLLLALQYVQGNDAGAMLAEHRAWAQQAEARVEKRSPAVPRRARERIHVAYLSPDLRRHAVAQFLLPVLAAHDRERFHVSCYSDAEAEDDMTVRLRERADAWCASSALGNAALATRIAQDGVDILVDLAGHSGGGHRMPLFAARAAPVQVTWLGYPGTTGLASMDYRLTDAVADPEGETERFHSERLVRLSPGFLCYGAPLDAPAVTPGRAGDAVTFGCFNTLPKIGAETVAAWARLLRELPRARLALKCLAFLSEQTRARTLQKLAAAGIEPARLRALAPLARFDAHLAAYADIDIALDVFPYNGTTTTCEALWMGVPVVSRCGRTHVTRVGASILRHAGLPELVATGWDDYIEKARALALDPERRAELRAGLRQRLRGSPLLDAQAFARSLESAYAGMLAKGAA